MTIEEIRALVEGLDGVLTIAPGPGDGTPELAWGDLFFYYAPDGVLPKTQPFATIVTKDYPDEPSSGLDRPEAFRVNIGVSTEEFVALVGRTPREPAVGEPEPDVVDTVIAHPTYGGQGWLAVVDPGPRTETVVRDLLRAAHDRAANRARRRAATGDQ